MATAAIDGTLDDALATVRQVEPIVPNIFDDDPERLAATTGYYLTALQAERVSPKAGHSFLRPHKRN